MSEPWLLGQTQGGKNASIGSEPRTAVEDVRVGRGLAAGCYCRPWDEANQVIVPWLYKKDDAATLRVAAF